MEPVVVGTRVGSEHERTLRRRVSTVDMDTDKRLGTRAHSAEDTVLDGHRLALGLREVDSYAPCHEPLAECGGNLPREGALLQAVARRARVVSTMARVYRDEVRDHRKWL